MAPNDITKLIDAGKEKGYLSYNEVNDLIPHYVHFPEAMDDLLTTIGTQGIDVLGANLTYLPRPSTKSVRIKWRPARTSIST